MKVIQFTRFGDRNVLDYVDAPRPVARDDELLVEVMAAGVNFADTRERQGGDQTTNPVALPRIPGMQVAGRVIEVGPRGDHRRIGKKVVALLPTGGGYAQYAVAPLAMAVMLPEAADPLAMATLPVQGITAYLLLNASTQLQHGETVLVHGGAGGVGCLAIQVAKLLGAGRVIATASTEHKRAFARSLGADVALAYDEPNWTRDVLDETAGRGVDIILESIGGEVFEQNFECLATFGRCLVLGALRGPGKPFEPHRLMAKSQSLIGFHLPVFYRRPELVHEALSFLVAHALEGTLHAHASSVLPLRRAAEAHQLLEDRRAVGAVLLDGRDVDHTFESKE
jgi:NADPH2:quinone reductase